MGGLVALLDKRLQHRPDEVKLERDKNPEIFMICNFNSLIKVRNLFIDHSHFLKWLNKIFVFVFLQNIKYSRVRVLIQA